MKVCVAQTKPFKGAVEKNIAAHKKLVELASSFGADIIVFPELSITGYEPELAKDLAINDDDMLLDVFQLLSDTKKITICIGMPTKRASDVLISMIIFQPHQQRQTYSKQLLHSDEKPLFIEGDTEVFITIDNIKVAPAICYESLIDEHSEKAFKNGAEIYVASVAKSAAGVEKAVKHFPEVAKRYLMPVLMANCVGPCDNFISVGRSAIWNTKGKIIAQLDDTNEGILIMDTETEEIVQKPITTYP